MFLKFMKQFIYYIFKYWSVEKCQIKKLVKGFGETNFSQSIGLNILLKNVSQILSETFLQKILKFG